MSIAIKQQHPHSNLGVKVFKPLMNLGIKTYTNHFLRSQLGSTGHHIAAHTPEGIINNVANSADVAREPIKYVMNKAWQAANHVKHIKTSSIEKAKKKSHSSSEKSKFQ